MHTLIVVRRLAGALGLAVALVLPVSAAAQNAFTTQAVNMRAGPDRSFPLVAWIPAGASVQVFGCVEGWRWCDTQWGRNRGWVWSQALQTIFGSQPGVIFHGGPTLGIPLVTFSIGSYWGSFYRGRPWWDNRNYWMSRPPPPRPPAWRPPPPGWHHPPGVRPPPQRPPSSRPPPRPTPPVANPPPRPIQPPATGPGPGPRPPGNQVTRPPRPAEPGRPGAGGTATRPGT